MTNASATLRDRILGKVVMAGPATPCAIWVGAYNRPGKHSIKRRRPHERPVVRLGGQNTSMVYVAPTMLQLAGIQPERPEQVQACHTCPCGAAWHGRYTCVDLAHLRWGSQAENEADKLK